jgi:hypothetical protein
MIKQARFKNFKLLRDLTLNFEPGVNIITGSSDSGKTTSLKGMLWALQNMPQGKPPICHGEKECSVTVTTDKGEIERGVDERNYYQVNGERLTAFRNNLPPEVDAISHMADINVQHRRDLPFMISEKAGASAERLSEMMDLQEIGESLSRIDIEVKRLEKAAAETEKAHTEAAGEAEALNWVDNASAELNVLQGKQTHIDGIARETEELSAMLSEYRRRVDALNELKGVDKAKAQMELMMLRQAEYDKAQQKLSEYSALSASYDTAQRQAASLEGARQGAEKCARLMELYAAMNSAYKEARELGSLDLQYGVNKDKLRKLEKAHEAYRELILLENMARDVRKQQQEASTLQKDLDTSRRLNSETKEAQQALQALQAQFHESMPDVCPLCGSLTKEEK